ncbi:MAG: hypothetical protein PVJ71_04115 [Lysobacterales bacterium]
MKLPRSMSTAGLLAILLGLALFTNTASAQLQPWEDFEASDGVWIVTMVDLDPGAFGIYLEGLKSTWIAANEVAKELGQIKDYGIYANQYGSSEDFDLLLVVQMEGTDDIAPNRERYDKFLEAYGQANIDKGNETVLELYNKIRRIQGNYMLRKITVK